MTQSPLERLAAWAATPRGAALSALFLMLLFVLPGQTTIPPIDRDEPRFAQATRQMVETGDYVDIRYLDKPRYLQPVGIYWLQATSLTLLGQQDEARAIWPHRVPSWLAAIATMFLTWWVGALLFGRNIGRLAGALMGAAVLLGAEARFAKIDSTLCAVTLLTQAALARIYVARDRNEKLGMRWPALFWAAFGVGVLLKGPIILLVTGGTILGLVLLERRAGWLMMLRPLWGVPLMLAVVTPWYIAIALATDGAFYRTAVSYSVVGKVASSHQRHGGPIGYYLMLFPAAFWPGSLIAFLSLPFVWANRTTPAVRFCIAWIVPAWLFWELTKTKLPHYTLPLFPAVAILSAAAAEAARGARWFGRPRLFAAVSVLWIALTALIAFGPPALRVQIQQDGATGPLALGAVALLVAGLALGFLAQGRPRAGIAALVASGLVVSVNTFGLTVPGLTNVFMSPRIAAAVDAHRPCPRTAVTLLGYHEPSLVFLLGQGVGLATTADEAATRVARDPACALLVAQGADFEPARTQLEHSGVGLEALAAIRGANVNEHGSAQIVTVYRPVPR